MSERDALIRPQVLANFRGREYSEPLFRQRALVKLLVCFAVVLLLLAMSLLGLTRYKVTESAPGLLSSPVGAYRVVAPTPALVSEVLVQAGQTVEQGHRLATLRKSSFTVEGEDSGQLELDRLQKQRQLLDEEQALLTTTRAQRREHLARVIADLETSLALSADETALTQDQLERSATQLAALTTLRASRAITALQLDQAWVEHVNIKLRLNDVEQRRQATITQLNLQRAQQASLKGEYARESLQLQQAREQLDQTRAQLVNGRHLSVIAEAPGIVSAVAVQANQYVVTGQPMFYIDDTRGPLEAALYVPSRLHGKLHIGQELWLDYDAFDYRHYGRYLATITEIANSSLDPREHLLPIPSLQEPMYKITARLEHETIAGSEAYPVQAGMRFSANIVLEEMSLLAYLFRPVFELRARVS